MNNKLLQCLEYRYAHLKAKCLNMCRTWLRHNIQICKCPGTFLTDYICRDHSISVHGCAVLNLLCEINNKCAMHSGGA